METALVLSSALDTSHSLHASGRALVSWLSFYVPLSSLPLTFRVCKFPDIISNSYLPCLLSTPTPTGCPTKLHFQHMVGTQDC
jgi:hypothetical protein